MGGDFGPQNIVGGAVMALKEYPHIAKLFLVGDTPRIEKELKQHRCNDGRIEIVHATQVVEMSDGAPWLPASGIPVGGENRCVSVVRPTSRSLRSNRVAQA